MDQLSLKPQEDRSQPAPSLFDRARTLINHLDRAQRIATTAAIALIFTEFLPWFSGDLVLQGRNSTALQIAGKRSALDEFSLVELALLVIAACVLVLIFMRVEKRDFHLPMHDGTFFAGAGLWAAVLIVYRMLARPARDLSGIEYELGLSWGILLALAIALFLGVTGLLYRKRTP